MRHHMLYKSCVQATRSRSGWPSLPASVLATIGALEEGLPRRPYPNTLRALAEAPELSPSQRTALFEAVSSVERVRPREAGAGSANAGLVLIEHALHARGDGAHVGTST
jgi:hypothetical protein